MSDLNQEPNVIKGSASELARVKPRFPLNLLQIIALIGCLLIIVGIPMPMARFHIPGHNSWFAGGAGTGTPVALFATAMAVMILYRRNVLVTFMVIFCSFFLLLDILVAYDSVAIAQGTATDNSDPFRFVIKIFMDAFSFGNGAFTVAAGLALILCCVIIDTIVQHIDETIQLESKLSESIDQIDSDVEDEDRITQVTLPPD